MKHLMLCLAVFIIIAAPCAAQKASGPFADVPPNTWPYAAVQTLERAGIVLGYPDGTYGGRREMTRYEFAVAVARLLAQLPHDDTDMQKELGGKLQKSPLALNASLALTAEFAPEVNRLTLPYPEEARRFAQTIALMRAWQKQARQDIQGGKIVLMPEEMQSPFADVSPVAIYQQRDEITKAGFVFGAMDEITLSDYRMNHMTRLEFARAFGVTLNNLNKRPLWDVQSCVHGQPQAAEALRVLLDDFTPELRLLGQDTNLYQSRLVAWTRMIPLPLTAKPFPDVSLTHWAASAVETLRVNRIFAGYPQGIFTVAE